MAMNNAKYWALFKIVRVLVYSVSTLLSIGFTAIYAVLLLRGWKSYTGEQRTVVIVLVAIDALSSVMLYLMLIFRFRLWLDGIRIAILLFFQAGPLPLHFLTKTFHVTILARYRLAKQSKRQQYMVAGRSPDFVRYLFPVLKTAETLRLYTVLLFAFYLAAMSYVPEPKPRPNPEALLALNLANAEKREKRVSTSSFGSATSAYSQKSYLGPLQPSTMQSSIRSARPPHAENGRITPYNYVPTAPQSPARAVRSPSIASTQRSAGPYNNYYRPGTPGSIRSMAPSTMSNIRASTRQRYYISNRIPAPQPRAAEQLQAPRLANQQSFSEPVSRQGTPMSVMSNQSQYAPHHQRQPAYLSPPPGLGYVGNGLNLNFPQPPGYARGPAYPARVTSPLASPIAPVSMVSDQRSMGMQMREALMMRTPSPGAHSLNSPTSPDSMHSPPSGNPSVSSVPRSPSPQHGSFSNLPTTPLSAVLPAHPGLPSAQGRSEVRDVQRYGTPPGVRLNERLLTDGQYRTGSAPPRNWAASNNSRMDAVDYWRQQSTEPLDFGGRRTAPSSGARFASTRTFQSPIWKAVHEAGQKRPLLSSVAKGFAVAGVGIGLSSLRKDPIQCDAPQPPKSTDPIYPDDRPPPPVSSVSLYELSFGTVVGLCAGVFVKKGAKAVAWFLGGVFVLLQYMGSASLVRVDWGKAAGKFENLFYTKDAAGGTRPPNVLSLWHWLINFLTADFQPRASFIAGFVLGLRIG
ncbi:hypothetical protein CVT25_003977 [Psilocybe cyanescens]|uniref:Uncharacterized protein n=1 Tax=Psilocybe cyanescens TaxID=93625 RepID=A0A409WXU6_PSICY|nr:hypothetical protein CVT25_003977 [Psilocybe cyanescens]